MCKFTAKREGSVYTVVLAPETKVAKDLLGDDTLYYDAGFSGLPPLQGVVGAVADGYPAKSAGLKKGDLIVEINGQPVDSWSTMKTIISQCEGERLFDWGGSGWRVAYGGNRTRPV
jgi:S1-C subfamily serine protease